MKSNPDSRLRTLAVLLTGALALGAFSVAAQTAYDPYGAPSTGAPGSATSSGAAASLNPAAGYGYGGAGAGGGSGYSGYSTTGGLGGGQFGAAGAQQANGGVIGGGQDFAPTVLPDYSNFGLENGQNQQGFLVPTTRPTGGPNPGPLYARPTPGNPGQFELLQQPAPKLSEFETFVNETIGRPLPRFGSSLVLSRNRGFADVRRRRRCRRTTSSTPAMSS